MTEWSIHIAPHSWIPFRLCVYIFEKNKKKKKQKKTNKFICPSIFDASTFAARNVTARTRPINERQDSTTYRIKFQYSKLQDLHISSLPFLFITTERKSSDDPLADGPKVYKLKISQQTTHRCEFFHLLARSGISLFTFLRLHWKKKAARLVCSATTDFYTD